MKNTIASDLVAKAQTETGLAKPEAVKACIFTAQQIMQFNPLPWGAEQRELEFHQAWNNVLAELRDMDTPQKQQPHCCPVCSGKGIVPNGFYGSVGSATISNQCKPCNGTGVIWN